MTEPVYELHPKMLLDSALKYAERGFRVLPLHSIRNNACTCGNQVCKSPGKHPLTLHGATDATTDETLIRGYWSQFPFANIGIAMGDNDIVALDVDTRNNGHLSLEALIQQHGQFPDTAVQRTGNGWHYLFRVDPMTLANVRGILAQGIDIKANGYIVAEPSIHHSGRRYAWDEGLDVLQGFIPARAPIWLERLMVEDMPQRSVNAGAQITLPIQLQEAADALKHLNAEDYHQWVEAGMALHATGLGDSAYQVWVEWSQTSTKYDHKIQRSKWLSFGKGKSTVTIKTLFARAQAAGWVNPLSSGAPAEAEADLPADLLENNLLDLLAPIDNVSALPHIVDRWVPVDEVTLFAGHGGSGKSFVAMNLAIHVALGLPFCGLTTKSVPVLFFSGEDGAQVILKRFGAICRKLNINPASLKDKLHLLDASDIDPTLHRDQRGGFETKLLGALNELVVRRNIGLVIIDNASDTYDDDEIKRARVRAFVRSLRTRIARPSRAVVLLAHINKASAIGGRAIGAEDYSGSTAWHNSVRSRLSLISEKDEAAFTIEHLKANLGPRAAPVKMRWYDGVPLLDGSATDSGAVAAAAILSASDARNRVEAKHAIVAMVGDFDRRGETVTTASQGPYNIFAQLKGRTGFPKSVKNGAQLMDLFAELQAEGLVYRKIVVNADRKKREIFTTGVAPNSSKSSF